MYTPDSLAKRPNSTLVKLTTSFCVVLCIVVIIYCRDIYIICFALVGILIALEGYLAAKFYSIVTLKLFCALMGILTVGSIVLGTYTLTGETRQCGHEDETVNYEQCIEGVRVLGYTTLFAGTLFFAFTTFVTIYFLRLVPVINEHFWSEEDLMQMCYENHTQENIEDTSPTTNLIETPSSSPRGLPPPKQEIEMVPMN